MYIVIDLRRIAMGILGGILTALFLMVVIDMAFSPGRISCGVPCVPDNTAELGAVANYAKVVGTSHSNAICLDAWERLEFSSVIEGTGADGIIVSCAGDVCSDLDIKGGSVRAVRDASFTVDMTREGGKLKAAIRGYDGD